MLADFFSPPEMLEEISRRQFQANLSIEEEEEKKKKRRKRPVDVRARERERERERRREREGERDGERVLRHEAYEDVTLSLC